MLSYAHFMTHNEVCELLAHLLTTATVQWTSPRIDLAGVSLWAFIILQTQQ